MSGVFLDDETSVIPRADLGLTYCVGCGFATKNAAGAGLLDYAAIDRPTSQQMPDYAGKLLALLRGTGVHSGSEIVEAGCNDGSFLAYLSANGFTALHGIEPSHSLAEAAAAKGFAVENAFCSRVSAAALVERRGPFGAVVCRHTLEHVPDPADLIAAIGHLLARNGVALIEVPDFDWVIETLGVHEIWDEHVSYFSRENLRAALTSQGFEVLSCERARFRDTRNLVALARWRGVAQSDGEWAGSPQPAGETAVGCRDLGTRWHALTARLGAEARGWKHPVYAIGASHIQSNFIHFSGLSGIVDGMIDDDPRKAGQFVMLDRPRPVMPTTDVLESMNEGTILRTAFPYPAWMDRICAKLQPRGVEIVDPYGGLPHRIARPD